MNRTTRWRSCCFCYENELEKKRHVNVSSWQANFILVQDLQKPFEDLSFGLSLHTYYSTYYYYISKRWHSYFYRQLGSNGEHMVKSFPLSVIENYKYAFRQNYNPWLKRVNFKSKPSSQSTNLLQQQQQFVEQIPWLKSFIAVNKVPKQLVHVQLYLAIAF